MRRWTMMRPKIDYWRSVLPPTMLGLSQQQSPRKGHHTACLIIVPASKLSPCFFFKKQYLSTNHQHPFTRPILCLCLMYCQLSYDIRGIHHSTRRAAAENNSKARFEPFGVGFYVSWPLKSMLVHMSQYGRVDDLDTGYCSTPSFVGGNNDVL